MAGASAGMMIVAVSPSNAALAAMPCAWLPEEQATDTLVLVLSWYLTETVVSAAKLERPAFSEDIQA